MGSFYVTTAINYVNAAPHLGHAYEAVGADVLARHHRQRGDDVFFLTGTDEHGEPIALAAEEQGVSPQELADRNVEHFRSLLPRLRISNDFFIRTTDAGHVREVQSVLERVRENGHVYLGEYEGWYCPRCADFKADTEVGPGNTCLIHEIPLTREKEENYFFALSGFQDQIEQLVADPAFVQPAERRNEVLAFVRSGLRDVSLTRSKMSWGVPVPWDSDHVFYVWFDALINYYSALSYARPGEDLTDRYWPADCHVIGKDIIKFHAVFWPALLLAAGLELPRRVFVHGFLLGADGRKMSKSLGNVLDPVVVIDELGSDALRYYLLRDVTFGSDGATSIETVRNRYESELANDLGNLASRTIAMVARYRDSVVPVAAGVDPELATEFDGLAERIRSRFENVELTAALDDLWLLVRRLNRYVEEKAPWQLAKDEQRADELDVALASLTEGLRVLAILLSPFIPSSMETLLEALGVDDESFGAALFGAAIPGSVKTIEPLFPEGDGDGGSMIDSHTHLDSCEQPDEALVREAGEQGVRRLLTVGTGPESCARAIAAADGFPSVWAAIGHHPNSASGFGSGDLEAIEAFASHPRCAAVGETGLDYYRDSAPKSDQLRAFHAQIELARALARPLVIHTREAADDTIAVLRDRAAGLDVILHCFTLADRLDECLAEGWWISFAGNVTYPSAADLALAAERVPDDRLLVETDAPYLSPQPVRKERNRPAFVAHTARFVAERRGQSYEQLEAAVEANAARLFKW